MSIFESLENLNVSEECFNDIMDLVEAMLNELHAPNPSSINQVLNRKATQLELNTQKNQYFDNQAQEIQNNKGEFHKKNPSASTQDRYNVQTQYKNLANQEEKKGEGLVKGAKRLAGWVAKKKGEGSLPQVTINVAREMVSNGKKNEFYRQKRNGTGT